MPVLSAVEVCLLIKKVYRLRQAQTDMDRFNYY